MRYVIGITGGIASGKSTICSLLLSEGYKIIDSDQINKKLSLIGMPVYNEIVKHFGDDYVLPDGNINKSKLAKLIFSNNEAKLRLNEITHPLILKEIKREIDSSEGIVFVDVPLLFEGNLENLFDKIICVYLEKNIQLKRLMHRDNIDENYALQKINSQMDLDIKKMKSDFVIDTNCDLDCIKKQINSIINIIKGEILYGNY